MPVATEHGPAVPACDLAGAHQQDARENEKDGSGRQSIETNQAHLAVALPPAKANQYCGYHGKQHHSGQYPGADAEVIVQINQDVASYLLEGWLEEVRQA